MEERNFLQKIGVLENVLESFTKYVNYVKENGPDYVSTSIVIPLTYNYSHLVEHSKELLDSIILEPRIFDQELYNKLCVFLNAELEKMSAPFKIPIGQIHFVHRFSELPLTEQYKFHQEENKSLSNFECIVVGRYEEQKYIRQTVWYCDCTPNVVSRDAPICENLECRRIVKECIKFRDVSEQVKLIVFPVEMVKTPRCKGKVYRKFTVILRDDLARIDVGYGTAYRIAGFYDVRQRAYYAWNIVEMDF